MRVAPKMGRAFSQGRVRWYLLGLLSPAVGSSSANAQVCATQPCPAQRAMWIICATLYDTFVSLTSFRGFSYFKYSTL
jgi:hypothetical protein